MDSRTVLKQTIAELYQTDEKNIDSNFNLKIRRMEGSVGSGIIDAAVRRKLGIVCRKIYSVRTYGELEAAVLGTTEENTVADVKSVAQTVAVEDDDVKIQDGGLSCGLDVEMVENLPDARDYWTSDFYRSSFSDAEIAFCVVQDNPRMHFAARWCAKEALKKCGARYSALDLREIEVASEVGRRPALYLNTENGRQKLAASVSMTHTPHLAAAVVVCLELNVKGSFESG